MVTDRQWTAFVLIFGNGLTYEQAAEKMNISKAAVAGLIKRVRHKYPDCVPKVKKGKMLSFDLLTEDEKAHIREKF